jgi:hypothetical protein
MEAACNVHAAVTRQAWLCWQQIMPVYGTSLFRQVKRSSSMASLAESVGLTLFPQKPPKIISLGDNLPRISIYRLYQTLFSNANPGRKYHPRVHTHLS